MRERVIINFKLLTKLTAGLRFYVTHKFLFFPPYQTLSTMAINSSTKLDSTIPQNTSQVSPAFYLCSCFWSLLQCTCFQPCLLQVEDQLEITVHSFSIPCICQMPTQFFWSTYTISAVTKVSLVCLIFSAFCPYYFWIFKAKEQTHILIYLNMFQWIITEFLPCDRQWIYIRV